MITRRMAVIPGVVLSCLSAFASATGAQTRPTMDAGEPQKMLLWEHGAPGALGSDESDKPTLTYYPPTHGNPSGTAVIIAPGGGYTHLAANHEGRQPLEIEHKATLVLFSRPWGSLMFEGKGDHPYVEQDVCARGMPGFCGRLRRQRPHRLSKRDFAANGLDVLRDAGKRIKVRSR